MDERAGAAAELSDAEPGDAELRVARRAYATELKYLARVRSPAVVEAFASVPREHFLGPGPWQILGPLGTVDGEYWLTDDADPRHLYHNILIAIDASRGLNNGQPSFWAYNLDFVAPKPGEQAIHIGCGTGYYSALLAELVGPAGRVIAIEVDEELAARAKRNLTPWRNVAVLHADGSQVVPGEADLIVINAGATHPLAIWLDALRPGGRMILPLTAKDRGGRLLKVTRVADGHQARFISHVGIFDLVGARDAQAGERLGEALARGNAESVASLRRDAHAPEDTCWLHGEGYCLSTAAVGPPA